MATVYSDNFNVDSSGNFVPGLVDGSKVGGGIDKKRMEVATGALLPINEVICMGKFKSGDRLYDLRGSTDNVTTTAGDIDLGLFKSKLDHGGTVDLGPDEDVSCVDMFCDAEDINAAILDRADWFTESGDMEDFERGLFLWELVNVKAASTYTEDPQEDWDLCITVVEATTAAQIIVIEADFVSFG